MKVTFTCEKCGHAVFVSSWVRARDGDALRHLPPNTECPNCAKLTYGPLTEEMVADALIECSHSHDEVEDDYYECEARFVLRVLREANENDDLYSGPGGYNPRFVNWRDRLLDLARQK